jgi:phosphoglycolate phosphatase-like HAD superfamily hydrolase
MANDILFELPEFISGPEISDKIERIQRDTKLLVFDLDETILSHRLYVYERIIVGFSLMGLHTFASNEEQEVINYLKHSGSDGVLTYIQNKLLPDISMVEMIGVLRDQKLKINQKLERANAVEVLNYLMEGYKVVICTNGNRKQQENKIRYLMNLIGREIPTFYCADSKPKPKPDCLISAMQKYQPNECVFIGDAVSDAMAAKATGTKFIHVSEIEKDL